MAETSALLPSVTKPSRPVPNRPPLPPRTQLAQLSLSTGAGGVGVGGGGGGGQQQAVQSLGLKSALVSPRMITAELQEKQVIRSAHRSAIPPLTGNKNENPRPPIPPRIASTKVSAAAFEQLRLAEQAYLNNQTEEVSRRVELLGSELLNATLSERDYSSEIFASSSFEEEKSPPVSPTRSAPSLSFESINETSDTGEPKPPGSFPKVGAIAPVTRASVKLAETIGMKKHKHGGVWKIKNTTSPKSPHSTAPPQTPEHTPAVPQTEELSAEDRRHRTLILVEILTTEDDYVKDLDLIVEVYLRPIREKNILSTEELNRLFSNIETILNINRIFQNDLRTRMRNSHNTNLSNVGDIFKNMADYFKMYTTYCANQPVAIKTLQSQQNNPAFAAFLAQCDRDPRCQGLTIFSYLIKPVQRLCKYPLFMKDLLKHTPVTSSDYPVLAQAAQKIDEVVNYINEKKRIQEDLQKVVDIQETIEGLEEDIVLPARRFIKETDCVVQTPEHEKPSECRVFLFNDLIIFAKHVSKKLRCRGKLKINHQLKLVVSATSCDLYSTETPNVIYKLNFKGAAAANEFVTDIRTLVKPFQLKRFTEQVLATSSDEFELDRFRARTVLS